MYTCDLCSKNFNTKQKLTRHCSRINACNLKTDYNCKWCNKSFFCASNKLRHEKNACIVKREKDNIANDRVRLLELKIIELETQLRLILKPNTPLQNKKNSSVKCEHNRRTSECRECGGSRICEHDRRKSECKDCGGSQVCHHNKIKSYCKICGGSSLCHSSWCHTSGSRKYEGYCMPCFVNNPANMHKPAMRNYKTKEKEVVDCVIQHYPQFTWIADRKVQYGCSQRRPDLLLDMGTHIIIVEVDENKHTSYDCSCENKRLMEISQDVQHRSIVFIRFNPDSYKDQNGVTVESCWKLNKLGVMTIVATNEWNERLKILIQQIKYWVDNPTEKTVEIVELFY